jgi:hypothetical protein
MLVTLARARLEPVLAEITDDTLLTERINSAQLQIEGYCRRKFESEERTDIIYVESANHEAHRSIFLPTFPVTEVSSIEIVNRDWTSEVYTLTGTGVAPDGFYLRQDTGELIAIDYIYFNEVHVTYTAGFTTVPEDVQEACLKLLILMTSDGTLDAEYGNVSMEAEMMGKYSYKVGKVEGAADSLEILPPSVRALLAKYKVIVI